MLVRYIKSSTTFSNYIRARLIRFVAFEKATVRCGFWESNCGIWVVRKAKSLLVKQLWLLQKLMSYSLSYKWAHSSASHTTTSSSSASASCPRVSEVVPGLGLRRARRGWTWRPPVLHRAHWSGLGRLQTIGRGGADSFAHRRRGAARHRGRAGGGRDRRGKPCPSAGAPERAHPRGRQRRSSHSRPCWQMGFVSGRGGESPARVWISGRACGGRVGNKGRERIKTKQTGTYITSGRW